MGLVLADAVRAAAGLSVAVGLLQHGGIAGALFFLVLGGTIIPRALGVPAALDVAFSGTMVFAAWAAVLDWYVSYEGLDLVVHIAATGLVATLLHLALVRLEMVPPPGTDALARSRWGSGILTVSLGMALATLWEFGEWLGHTYLDDRIQVGYADTVGDLAAGALGSLMAAVLLARRRVTASSRP